MDKDQVLEVMDAAKRVAVLCDPAIRLSQPRLSNSLEAQALNLRGEIDEARAAIQRDYAELESLRAMRKRVEGLADEWTPTGWSGALSYGKAARELRAALGDSHE